MGTRRTTGTRRRDAERWVALRRRRVRERLFWRTLGALFVLSGVAKLAGAPWAVALFDRVAGSAGGGRELRIVTGVLEVSGAVLLVRPRLMGAGALLLSCVVSGALVAHVAVLHVSPALPLALMAILLPTAWRRRGDVARAMQRPAPVPVPGRWRRSSGAHQSVMDRRHHGWPGGRHGGPASRVQS